MKTRLVYLQSGFLKKVRNDISIKEEKYGFTLSKLYEMMSYTIDTSICTDMTLAEIEDDELLGPLSCETYCSNFEIKTVSKDIIENALKSKEENIEDLSAVYMLSESKMKCDGYGSQKGILVINPENLAHREDLFKGQFFSVYMSKNYKSTYLPFSDKLKHVCNSMIVIDPYILINTKSFNKNLFPLLNSILPEKLTNIPFHLSIFSQIGHQNNGNGESIYRNIKDYLTKIRPQPNILNIELSIYRVSTCGNFHSRHIITNNALIDSPDGFDLFNDKKNSTKNATITKVYPRFSGDARGDMSTYLDWIAFAKEHASKSQSSESSSYQTKWGDGENRLFDMIEDKDTNNNSSNKPTEIKKSSVQHQETTKPCSNNIASNSKTKDSKTEYIYLKISAERYPEIEQKPLNSKQKLEENRSTNEYKVIKIPFIENSELESRILYYSPDIEVIEPECLKEKIVNRLSDTLNKYKKNPSMQKGCIVNV